MSATQISFLSFALAAQHAASPCAPPVIDTAVAVVAHPLAVDGGECAPRIRVCYVVDIHWPGLPVKSFRWFKAKDAKRCVRDFPNGRAVIRPTAGYLTVDGFVEVRA